MLVLGEKLDNIYTHKRPMRSGVIPYTVYNNKLWFLLGIDRKTREFTDFGGGVRATESLVDAGLREFQEESCKIFNVKKDMLLGSPCVINEAKTAVIFFIQINPLWIDNAEKFFLKNQSNLAHIKKYNELFGVKWVDGTEFKNIIYNYSNHSMWIRVKKIIKQNVKWTNLYLALLLNFKLKIESVENDKFNEQSCQLITVT